MFPNKCKIFTLDDYSAHLDTAVKEALWKKGYFLVVLPLGITGELKVNDTDMHHPFKALYCDKESALMIEKLQEHPNEVPSLTRDDIMNMWKFVWNEAVANVDVLLLSYEMLSISSLMVLNTTW